VIKEQFASIPRLVSGALDSTSREGLPGAPPSSAVESSRRLRREILNPNATMLIGA
jgi:hypothetical protein